MKPKPEPANTKALQAWQSELRRLERRLEEWSNDLAVREKNLEEQETAFANALNEADDGIVHGYANNLSQDSDDEDCGCADTDAGAGCDCPKCRNIRADWVGGPGFSEELPPEGFKVRVQRVLGIKPPEKGDELKWLENLYKLKDNRKKK